MELTYGSLDHETNFSTPNNRSILSKILKHIVGYLHQGVKRYSSVLAAKLRSKAIGPVNRFGAREKPSGLKNRGKDPRALFLASTVARGMIIANVDKDDIAAECRAATERITTRVPLPDVGVMRELEDFIDRIMKPHLTKTANMGALPLPNTKCCFQYSSRKGGNARAVYECRGELEKEGGLMAFMSDPDLRQRRVLERRDFILKELLVERGGYMIDWSDYEKFQQFVNSSGPMSAERRRRELSFLERSVLSVHLREGSIQARIFATKRYPGIAKESDAVVKATVWADKKAKQILQQCYERYDRLVGPSPNCIGGATPDGCDVIDPMRFPFPPAELQKRYADLASIYREKYKPLHNRSTSTVDLFQKVLAELRSRTSRCKIAPIVDSSGKIRVATIADGEHQWISRALNGYLMPYTRKFTFSRDALKNTPTFITKSAVDAERPFVYSADLSKSTDPISLALSSFVIKRMLHNLPNHPEWVDRAVDAVLQRMELYDAEGKPLGLSTECGALMGDGYGWTVLCMLNAFCAERGGAKRGDYSVCGDDLIGLWSLSTIQNYETNLQLFGLVPNTSKSFISEKYGVFCERFVTLYREGTNWVARGSPETRIGEAVGARAISNQKGLCVVDDLVKAGLSHANHKIIRKVCLTTASAMTNLRAKIPGPFVDGGSGEGKADLSTVLSYIMFGPVTLTRVEGSEEMREFRAKLEKLSSFQPKQKGRISVDQAEIRMMSELTRVHRSDLLDPVGRPLMTKREDLKSELARRAKKILDGDGGFTSRIDSILKSGVWMDKVKVKQFPAKIIVPKKTARQVLAYCRVNNPKRALRALKNCPSRTVPEPDFVRTCKDVLPEYQEPILNDLTFRTRLVVPVDKDAEVLSSQKDSANDLMNYSMSGFADVFTVQDKPPKKEKGG